MIAELVVDTIIKHILQQTKKLIHEHQIEACIPIYLKDQSIQQIKSAINLYQFNCEASQITLDDQEYHVKPSIDSFQALTMKLIERPVLEQQTLSVTTTQKSLIQKHSYKKKVEVRVVKIDEVKTTEMRDEEPSLLIYKQQINTNSNNRHSLIMKQQIRDMTSKKSIILEHMYIDNFDANEFRKKLQNQAEQIEKDIKQMNRSFQVKKSEKSFEVINSSYQNKPQTATPTQRRPQHSIQQKSIDPNLTFPHPQRQLTPIVVPNISRKRNVSLN